MPASREQDVAQQRQSEDKAEGVHTGRTPKLMRINATGPLRFVTLARRY
jgi:hypothetical protein